MADCCSVADRGVILEDLYRNPSLLNFLSFGFLINKMKILKILLRILVYVKG